MGICLSLCGRTGKYKPRKMEEEDRARNREIQHNVYRKANDAQTEQTFDSKTVAQSMPFTVVRVYGDDSEEMPKHYQITSKEFKDLIKDLISFEGMDSPNEYQEMKLTGEQKEAIKTYFSRLTRNELSFCYQYFPPFLPPGPDGISANHLELYLEKGDLDVIFAAIEYLRQRQFHKLIRALDRLNNYFSLGIDEEAAKATALEIFQKWEKPYQRHIGVNNSRIERASACFYVIRNVVPNLRFAQPQGCIIPWILFQALHPIEENSGFLRVDGENLVESTSDRERGSFPPAVDLVEEHRKSTLIKMEDKLNRFVKTDCTMLTWVEGNLIRDLYDFKEADKSTMAKSIPAEYADDIWICYYTVYKYFTGDALSSALNSKAPLGSLKEYMLLQENTDTIVKCHQLADQHDGEPEKEDEIMRHVNGNLDGKQNDDCEIMRVDKNQAEKTDEEVEIKPLVDGNLAGRLNEEGEIMRHVDKNVTGAQDEEGKIVPPIDGKLAKKQNEEGEIMRHADGKFADKTNEEGEIMRHVDKNLTGAPDEEGKIVPLVDGKLADKLNEEAEIMRHADGKFDEKTNEEGEIMRHVDKNLTGAPDGEGKIVPLVDGKLADKLNEEGEIMRHADGKFDEKTNEEGEIMRHVDKNVTGEPEEEGEIMRYVDGNLPGEPNEEGEIMHFNESMIGDANDDQDLTDRELGVPRREEFFEIKERAEKQKRWKRRFDSTKGTESEHEETKS